MKNETPSAYAHEVERCLEIRIHQSQITEPPQLQAATILLRARQSEKSNFASTLHLSLFGRRLQMQPSLIVALSSLVLVLNLLSLSHFRNLQTSTPSRAELDNIKPRTQASIRDVVVDYLESPEDLSLSTTTHHD